MSTFVFLFDALNWQAWVSISIWKSCAFDFPHVHHGNQRIESNEMSSKTVNLAYLPYVETHCAFDSSNVTPFHIHFSRFFRVVTISINIFTKLSNASRGKWWKLPWSYASHLLDSQPAIWMWIFHCNVLHAQVNDLLCSGFYLLWFRLLHFPKKKRRRRERDNDYVSKHAIT